VLAVLRGPFATTALWLSLATSGISVVVAVLLGTPTAYLLARRSFPGRTIVDTLIDLPIVLPPIVGGLALLVALGRQGVIGGPLDAVGINVTFTTGAVVVAQLFVSVPFYVRAARAGFEGVDRRLEAVSATLGASGWRTFRRVTVPLALPSLISGAVMCWARALGEFGATIMFAGNVTGRTQTMPLAILEAIETDVDAALAIAIVLIVIAFAVLVAFKGLARIGGRVL
jgi:molybdate transport system permease protein